MTTYIIIDNFGSRQATIKADNSHSASLIYTEGSPISVNSILAVREDLFVEFQLNVSKIKP